MTTWRRLLRNRLAASGAAVLLVVCLAAAIAPLLPLADPAATDLSKRLLPPLSERHLLGTDQLGRDVLARLVWGARASLVVGVVATLVAALLGTAVGIMAAHYGRLLDTILMRGIDVLMAFPYLLLALAVVAVLGPGLRNAMIAIAVVNIPFFARAVRGAALSLKEQDYIAAARLAGFGEPRIMLSEILPNVVPAVVVMMATTLGWMILETAGLSFLGLGAQPPRADLGSMLGDGRQLVTIAPHVSVIPGLAIFLVVMGVNLLGDGVRDALDPRLAAQAEGSSGGRESAAGAHAGTESEDASGTPASREAGAADPLLRVSGVSTYFFVDGEVHRAVDDVSFTVVEGEALGIVGESGSGKTVSVLTILGLLPQPPGRVVRGEAAFQGKDLLTLSPEQLRRVRGDRIGYVPQDPMTGLNPVLTVGEQIAEVVRAHRDVSWPRARKRAVELLDHVRLPEPERQVGRYPHELSGGMRQRVLIAAALANDPDLVIADEPTTALDVTIQAEILDLLVSLRKERNAALLFITHDIGIVSRLCDRVLVMYAGRVVESASIETIFRDPRHPYTRRLLGSVPVLGRADRPLRPIPGLPPPANDLPPGCHFAPRCEWVLDACREPPIRLEIVNDGHRARCIRAREDIVKGAVL